MRRNKLGKSEHRKDPMKSAIWQGRIDGISVIKK